MKLESVTPCNHRYDRECQNCVMNQLLIHEEFLETNEALQELLELSDDYD